MIANITAMRGTSTNPGPLKRVDGRCESAGRFLESIPKRSTERK